MFDILLNAGYGHAPIKEIKGGEHMNEATSQQADNAFGAYQVKKSNTELIAWFRAELACDSTAMRQHGHHDDDVLYRLRDMVMSLTYILYEQRTGKPVPKPFIKLMQVA